MSDFLPSLAVHSKEEIVTDLPLIASIKTVVFWLTFRAENLNATPILATLVLIVVPI